MKICCVHESTVVPIISTSVINHSFTTRCSSNSLREFYMPEHSRDGLWLCHTTCSTPYAYDATPIPAQDRVFHIFRSKITIARRCDRSPHSRNIFIFKVFSNYSLCLHQKTIIRKPHHNFRHGTLLTFHFRHANECVDTPRRYEIWILCRHTLFILPCRYFPD